MILDPNTEELKKKFAHIKGWAHDADPDDHPNYPMKHYTGDDHKRLNWDRPPQQKKTVEILQSTEHPRTPAAFGTGSPPSGLSGVIRRKAYTYSEGMMRHWLMLLMADRVDVIEGLLNDLRSGTFPDIAKERGMKAMWDHNKPLLAKRTMIRAAIYGAVIGFVAYNLLNDNDSEKPRKASAKKPSPKLVTGD